ncbi:MAG: 16S rRNA (uracil(1498)-N(3))-methyltransferase [Verrucomicrobia bacterium]|nr:16S rRNA (uracil(1498)-N(3))-methyltransferase [Verrucomicrobiota bacterium]
MSAHRFYISPERWSLRPLVLGDSEAHHCTDVLRLGVRSRIVVFNGRGAEIIAEITAIGKGRVHLKELVSTKTEPLRCSITLGQAIPKGKNMDLIIQKATELGASKIVLLISDRTVVQLEEGELHRKREKWKQVTIEAAKQSGQDWLPEIEGPVTPKQFFAGFDRYELSLVASLQNDARSLKKVLANFHEQHGRRPNSALILVGPEGDFTPAEISWAKSAGCVPVSLGPIVLRTETAAIYSLSMLAYELQGEEV